MSGTLTPEEALLQATARDFATREVAPGATERDETERYDRSLFEQMGALGLTAAPFPESVGGAGFSYLGWSLVMEELGAVDMAMAVSLSVHILSQYPVVTWGTPEQHARWLPPMLVGEALGAFALTEPHAGSDAAAIRTRADRVGPADAPEAYALTGTKVWISNAPEADRYLVFATLDPTAGPAAITAFLVEKGTPGFRFGAHERKMGIRACPAAELLFEHAEVPAANRLGAEGEGYKIALSALGEGRISIAAGCVGIARAALDQGLECLTIYAFSSENWNRPQDEVSGLMDLLAMAIGREVPQLKQDGVRLFFVGDRQGLSEKIRLSLEQAELATAGNSRLVLNVCFNYGGRWDIVQAVAKLAAEGRDATEANLSGAMALSHTPDPDLVIRTGNEQRDASAECHRPRSSGTRHVGHR